MLTELVLAVYAAGAVALCLLLALLGAGCGAWFYWPRWVLFGAAWCCCNCWVVVVVLALFGAGGAACTGGC